jgi:ParB/RepB/Spo0J family partition protein
MTAEGRRNQSVCFDVIDVHAIDPSPFQRRRFFDEDALRELGASIARDGLVEPIIVRPAENGRFQLIAGERRVKAVKQYTDRSAVQAKIIDVNDSQARRMSAAENLQRKDLSALEAIETTVDIVDAELSGEKAYLAGGKTPLERVHKCLTLLDSIRRSRDRGSAVSGSETALSHKIMGQVETIFKNLPNPLEWRSFLNNDLVLLTDIPEIVQNASIEYGLNKAQTKALARAWYPHCLFADFREFQGVSALEENPENAILMTDYAKLLESCGWQIIHLLDCPLSAERFTPTMVSRMQDGRSLGTVRRTLIVGKPDPLPA